MAVDFLVFYLIYIKEVYKDLVHTNSIQFYNTLVVFLLLYVLYNVTSNTSTMEKCRGYFKP